MLKVKDLKKEFLSANHNVKALQDVSFEVPSGMFAAIIGKSGSGKSTLLALLGALDKPTSGSVVVDDTDITKLSDARLIKYRRNVIGFVFQQYNLIPNLTAIENVMLPMEFAGVKSTERKKRAASLLEEVGLDTEKQMRR